MGFPDIDLNHHVREYFDILGRLKKWKTRIYDTGINYSTASNTKAITFYDLHHHCKLTKTELPASSKRIRIETSFNKMLPSIKELKNMLTLEDYTKVNNYQKLPKLWLSSYEAIEKNETAEHIPGLNKKEVDILDQINRLTVNGYRNKLRIDYPKDCRYHFAKLENLLQKMRVYRQKHDLPNLVDELNLKVRERAKQLILAS